MATIRTLVFVNLSSILFLSKFAVLISYDLLYARSFESFAVYSIVINLTSSIFNTTNLRARVFVLNDVTTCADIARYNSVLLPANCLGLAVAYAIFSTYEYFELILAIAAVKAVENIFDGNISFIQKRLGRNLAFKIINAKAIATLAVYGSFVMSGDLLLVLLLELFVGGVSITYAAILVKKICRSDSQELIEEGHQQISFLDIFKGVSLLSVCAGLNTLLNTVSVAYLMNKNLDGDAKIMASLFAGFAIVTRLLINNTFFFRREMSQSGHVLVRRARYSTVLGIVIFFVAFPIANLSYSGFHSFHNAILIGAIAAAFIIVHSANVLIRQKMLLANDASCLTLLHFVELLVLILTLVTFSPNLAWLMLIYFCLRSSRVYVMSKRI